MPKRAIQVIIVSISTIGSRVLGLCRDVLMFSVFGAGMLNSAFLLAFTFPNLFRRLLGEGALTAALVPVLTEYKEKSGKEGLFALYNCVLSRLSTLLFILVALGMIIMGALSYLPGLSERWHLALVLGVLLFLYLALVCLAAGFAAVLNVLHRFAIPAMTAVWLNLSMILSLGGVGLWITDDAMQRMYWLCGGVLMGGVFQVVIPAIVLKGEGWKPSLNFGMHPGIKEIVRLLLPGLAGAAVIQLNIVVSRSLAHLLNESAVSVMYLANRLVELPLGVFSIAVATVYFPTLAEWAARKNSREFLIVFRQGLRIILAITLPAMTGLIVLGNDILVLLFEWGAFDSKDRSMTLPILWIFALAMPAYSAVAFVVRGFYSYKDTKTPVRVAYWAFAINLILSLSLMWKFGIMGLASANAISILVQAWMLFMLFGKKLGRSTWQGMLPAGVKVVIGSLAMGGLVLVCGWGLETLPVSLKAQASLKVLVLIPVAVAFYLGMLWLLRFEEFGVLIDLIKRKKSRVEIVDSQENNRTS